MEPALNHATLTLSGRDLARMRRLAMATEGKVGAAKRVAAAVRSSQATAQAVAQREQAQCGSVGASDALCQCEVAATVSASSSQNKAAAALPSGRMLARARRQTLAQEGKPGIQKVANASRIAATMPDRADWQTALAQGVTGRQLAMQKRIVQSLAGRTEASHGSGNRSVARSRSRAVAERTEVGHTLSGQEVSGIQVERSSKVTGQEPGTCRNVTGTEYIGIEQYQAWCESKPQPRPPKVGLSQTTGQQQSISGTEVDPQPRVTGNQTGVCLGITGTQYLSAETASLCQDKPPAQGPRKVSVMSSRGQQTVTGVVLNGGSSVTGSEAGAQRPITGTQYARAVQSAPITMPASEARQPAPEQRQAQRQSASWRAQSLTGDRPGIGGGSVTGDERGACEAVTGTPFIGPDNQHAACTIDSAWLTRHPELAVETPPAAPKGFSIARPQRGQPAGRTSAPQSEPPRKHVTGVACGNSDRITGPGFKAQGVVTGTPEFRHGGQSLVSRRSPGSFVSMASPVLAASPPAAQPPASERLSGEGRQQGSRLTGDSWSSSRHISGTDGVSAQSRNPTQRGQARGMGMDARSVREQPRAEVPPSPVTGSSGNTGRGAMVTISGGARG